MSRPQGKNETFLALLLPLQQSLEVYCRRMLRKPAEVEDVLQQAIMEAYARFDRYVEGTNFRAWMFRFVVFEIFNRNRKREPVLFGDSLNDVPAESPQELQALEAQWETLLENPDSLLEHFEDQMVAALDKLALPERSVLLLRAVGDFSYHEIHEILSMPLGSVMGYLSRARRKMRQSLADYAVQRGLTRRQESRS